MNFLKLLLILLALGVGVILFFWLIGIVSTILWYLFWFGLIALGGYAGYKIFLEKEKEQTLIEEKTPIGIAEMRDSDRALEEYKRKHLSK